jgi:Replication protein
MLERVSADISLTLTRKELHKHSVLIDGCYGWKHCHSPYCLKCMSRRVMNERNNLKQLLPPLLHADLTLQCWFITAAAADNRDIRTHSLAAVTGMRRLLKHRRLKGRIVASFSVLEVAHKTSRTDPCAHIHTLIVTKPMDKGRHRISEAEWIRLWESVCPLARARDPTRRLLRANRMRPKANLSIVVQRVPRATGDIDRVVNYCTKWATPLRAAGNYRDMLQDPDGFIQRIESLRGVTRFFGSLHRQRLRTPKPAS